MKRARKEVTLTDGRRFLVEESTWEHSGARSAIEESARAEKAKLNGSGDPVYFYFLEQFYSALISCSFGEIPTPEEALDLPSEDLDRWYEALAECNPGLFRPLDLSSESRVEFRDGTSFRLLSSSRPSVVMKRARLEEEALRREEDRDNPKDIFAFYLYPILAACSIGDVPPPDEVRKDWPETEIYKWRDAVREVNPHWFMSAEEAREKTLSESEEEKKKD